MWFYSQKTGIIRHDEQIVGCGYAGNDLDGLCKNNPDAQTVHNHGPLPRGKYKMLTPLDSPHVGRYAIPLAPDMDNQMFGRTGFFVHGPNPDHPKDSSDGCIVAPLEERMRMVSSGDQELMVTE